MSMKVRIVRPGELSPRHVEAWRALQEANPELASPFFSPDFTEAVAAVRDDVWVAILDWGDGGVGFFPFQKGAFGVGGPVGGGLNDYHGVIAPPGAAWSVERLMRACGLATWEFHALAGSQGSFSKFCVDTQRAHLLNIDGGLEPYLDRLRKAGSSQPSKLMQMKRKFERDFGKVEFCPNVEDSALLDLLLRWKSEQYQASHIHDNFAHAWSVALMHRLHAGRHDHFSGMLSVLRADGEIVAMHFGIRSRRVWHWWFPRHDERFRKYNPGILLLLYALDHGGRNGLRFIDMGYGDETFKLRLGTDERSVARGRVEMASIPTTVMHWREGAERWLRNGPFNEFVKTPGRLVMRLEQWYRFH
jgi:CelD/BcsL family acetyltransferase involved in cellulose biosynthesis